MKRRSAVGGTIDSAIDSAIDNTIDNTMDGNGAAQLRPYLPRMTVDWYRDAPDVRHRVVDGSLVFVDLSGFTRLSERLARRGRIGAEQLTETLSSVFTQLLASAYTEGGSLLKFGGDALLLLFTGDDNAVHACRAANGMRAELRRCGTVQTDGAPVVLRMSVGVHSGPFACFLVGNSHRELIVTGIDATTTVRMEGAANAGEVMVSAATAARLPPGVVRSASDVGHRLRRVAIPGDVAAPAVTTEPLPPHVDLKPCVPAGTREHLAAGGDEAEHRVLTVAFVHFDGTDELLESGGIACVAAALDSLVRTVQAACEEHGVTFLGSDLDADGGKLILVGGAPRATDNDEERMLRALRRIVDTPGVLPVRIGVNRGHVFIGDVGPHYRRTYTVMGDTVNVAARLMAAASPASILATESVLERASTRFATEALPPLSLKGKAQRVQAFVVGAPTGSRRTETADLPFVGREAELDVLEDALESARRNAGAAVELAGEPGIGKSRLVRELQARAADADMVVAAVSCEPYESSTPYFVVRALLCNLFGAAPGSALVTVDRLRDIVARDAPGLLPWLPLLATPLGIDVDDTPQTAALEPQFRRDRVAEVTVEFLGHALARPALFVFEDVHWIDDASGDVLRRIAAATTERPWLLCVTRRSDQESDFALLDDLPVRRLHLEGLAPDAAARLIDAATEHAPLLPRVAAALADQAGGNPLFLEELARGGASAMTDAPDSVAAVIGAALDRLPSRRRRLLRGASVLGRRFDAALLEAILGAPLPARGSRAWTDLHDYLRWDGEGQLRFQQTLVRDAAYERLTFRERRQLHARAGEALEQRAAADVDGHAAVLSLHFYQAHRHDDAWRYARLAAQRAERSYANAEAAELYERALAAAKHLPELAESDLSATWTSLGDVRERAGDYQAASKAYRAARRLYAHDPIEDAGLLLKEAWIAERVSRLSDGLRWIRRGERRLEAVEGAEAARRRAQLAVWYAVIRQAQGKYGQALRAAQRAIDEAKACDERSVLAHAYLVLDWTFVESGRPERAMYSEEALRIYKELDDLGHQALALNNLGGLAYYGGRWRDALDLYARGRDARLRTGDEVEAARGTVNIGEILGDQGCLEEAEATLRDARRVWRAAGYRAGIPFVTMLLGRVAARGGRFDEAHAHFDDARAEMLAVGSDGELLMADAYLAECFVLEGRPDDASRCAAGVVARAARTGVQMLDPLLHRIEGIASAQRGDPVRARGELAVSLASANALHADHEVGLTLDVQTQLDVLQGLDATATSVARDEIFARLDVRTAPTVPLEPV